jgi:hypothetical protein
MYVSSRLLFLLVIFATSFSACKEKKECLKYTDEIYKDEKPDSSVMSEMLKYRSLLLKRFHETSIKGANITSYHLLFYSSHGYGKSIKLEQKKNACFLKVKCFFKEEIKQDAEDWFPDCKDYSTEISKDEWYKFEGLITNFNFWTAEQVDVETKGVLDGFVYLLEGNRPDAKKCGKKTYQIVARRSPEYDKMGALCGYILSYEDQLATKYISNN